MIKKKMIGLLSLCLLLPTKVFAPVEHHGGGNVEPQPPVTTTSVMEVKYAADQKTILDSNGNSIYYNGSSLIVGQNGIGLNSDNKITKDGALLSIGGQNLHIAIAVQSGFGVNSNNITAPTAFINTNFTADQISQIKNILTLMYNLLNISGNQTNSSYALFVLRYNQIIQQGELYTSAMIAQYMGELQALQQQMQVAFGGGQATGKQAMLNSMNADIASIGQYRVKYKNQKDLMQLDALSGKVVADATTFLQAAPSMDDFTLGQKSAPIVDNLNALLYVYKNYDVLEKGLKENLPKIIMSLAASGITVQNNSDMKVLQKQGMLEYPDPEIVGKSLINISKTNPTAVVTILPTSSQISKVLNATILKLEQLKKQNPQYATYIDPFLKKLNEVQKMLIDSGVAQPPIGSDKNSYAPIDQGNGNKNDKKNHSWNLHPVVPSTIGGGGIGSGGSGTLQVNPQLQTDIDKESTVILGLSTAIKNDSKTPTTSLGIVTHTFAVSSDSDPIRTDYKYDPFTEGVFFMPFGKIPVSSLIEVYIQFDSSNKDHLSIVRKIKDSLDSYAIPFRTKICDQKKYPNEAKKYAIDPKDVTATPYVKVGSQVIIVDSSKKSDDKYLSDLVDTKIIPIIKSYMQTKYPAPTPTNNSSNNALMNAMVPYLSNPATLTALPIVNADIPLSIMVLRSMENNPQYSQYKPQIQQSIAILEKKQLSKK